MTQDYPKLRYFKNASQADKMKAVGNWLRALELAGLLWHMDDSANDIPNFKEKGIADDLERERQKALTICDNEPEGIWGLRFWAQHFEREAQIAGVKGAIA
jgi:hypothetical protein